MSYWRPECPLCKQRVWKGGLMDHFAATHIDMRQFRDALSAGLAAFMSALKEGE